MKEIIELEYKKNSLEPSWFIKKPIDFEYKVYELMTFLKKAEENIYYGYWFPDFDIIEKRYADIANFKESAKISYTNKSDKELFEYIYDLPNNPNEFDEIQKIIEFGDKVLGNVYYELKSHLKYITSGLTIINKTTNRRTLPTYFIECDGTGVIEKYKVGKTNIHNLGSFHSKNYSWLKDEEHYVHVVCDIAINSERCIIPIVRKLIESGDYF